MASQAIRTDTSIGDADELAVDVDDAVVEGDVAGVDVGVEDAGDEMIRVTGMEWRVLPVPTSTTLILDA